MTDAVVVRTHVNASPETVFPYFTDPELVCRWMGVEARLEPIADGEFWVNCTGRDTAVGRYLEVSPHERVVFSWGWEGSDEIPPGSTTVEVTLKPEEEGTLVEVVHRGLPREEDRVNHRGGWEHYIGRLAAAAAGLDPGPDPNAAPQGEER